MQSDIFRAEGEATPWATWEFLGSPRLREVSAASTCLKGHPAAAASHQRRSSRGEAWGQHGISRPLCALLEGKDTGTRPEGSVEQSTRRQKAAPGCPGVRQGGSEPHHAWGWRQRRCCRVFPTKREANFSEGHPRGGVKRARCREGKAPCRSRSSLPLRPGAVVLGEV